MDIVHNLHYITGTGTCSVGIGTCSGICTCTNVRAQDIDYCVTTNGLVRFRNRIYVMDKNDFNQVILREFHVKPYLGHQCYQKKLTKVKKF